MRTIAVTMGLVLSAILPAYAITTGIPATGLPSADHYSAALLPEKEGIVPWRTLSEVKSEQVGIRVVNQFSNAILDLDQKEVKLQGFVVPLQVGDRQTRFLLSAVPPECPFCMPAGPDALVEVVAKKPVKYGVEPVVITGRFAVLKDDEGGLYYRLTGAEAIGRAIRAPTTATATATKLRE